MRTLAYFSRAIGNLGSHALGDLLDDARRFNGEHGLTGVLLHARGMFMQILEGAPIAIDEAMRRIRRSSKHDRLTVVCDETIFVRLFPAWAMGWPGNVSAEAAVRAVLDAAMPLPERATDEQADLLETAAAFLRDPIPARSAA
jgi:hypothetical protein